VEWFISVNVEWFISVNREVAKESVSLDGKRAFPFDLYGRR
jgi:hypothetical protein